MTEKNDTEAEMLAEIDKLIGVVEMLVDETASEVQMHYSDAELRALRHTGTIQALVAASRVLKYHELDLPGSMGVLLLILSENGEEAS